MFYHTGYCADTWSIGNLSNWDTSKVTDMSWMFSSAGENVTTFESIGTLKVYANNIKRMFSDSSNMKAVLNICNNPISYSYMFYGAATNPGSSIVVNYSSNVTNIDSILSGVGSQNITRGSLLD